jgi:nucleotide-binding universal stress UspA family protein
MTALACQQWSQSTVGARTATSPADMIGRIDMRILVALDRSEYAEIVLEHALDRATRDPCAELHFAIAIDHGRDATNARRWLDTIVRDGLDTFGQPDREFEIHVISGKPAPAICQLAREVAADMLVVGRFHVPSEAERFLALAPCPVLVVGPEGVELDAQCSNCADVRCRTDAERLFCSRHTSDRLPDLVTRIPVVDAAAYRRWWL